MRYLKTLEEKSQLQLQQNLIGKRKKNWTTEEEELYNEEKVKENEEFIVNLQHGIKNLKGEIKELKTPHQKKKQ